jgi:uroporphyrinogen decarboxylase
MKTIMTSRERLLAAAVGQSVDTIPVLYWLNPHGACRMMAEYRSAPSLSKTALAKLLWSKFRRSGHKKNAELARLLPYKLLEYANSEYSYHLGSDASFKSMGNFKSYRQAKKQIYRENGKIRFRDPFGAIRALGGIYLDVIQPPVQSAEGLASYRFPQLDNPSAIRCFRKKYPAACIMVEIGGPQQLTSQNVWNLEDYMLALYDDPRAIDAFHFRVAEWSLGIAKKAVQAGADLVFIGDDYGMNNAPLISMEQWKRYTFPHLKRMIREIHNMGVPVMLHSCGYQMPFLEYYCDAGLDVLQSFQPMAGNDFEAASREFGGRITFATGIDTQRGETMRPEELRSDMLERIDIGMSRGRFIMAMTHMLQYTMPLEIIDTIFKTVEKIRTSGHSEKIHRTCRVAP